jgi:succinate-semialdehyde dehydrogenase/glutarate-semialdehyde dehydrogenase
VTYSENKTFPVYEPATEAVLGNVPNFSRADFRVAIEDAQKGFIEYSENTLATQRGALLRKWYDLVMTNVDDCKLFFAQRRTHTLNNPKLMRDNIVAIILCLENGKTLAEARGEVEYAASFIKWFAEEAPRTYGETIPSAISEDTFVYTVREPIGVCAIITPWNFPAAMITRKIAPALAAGCSVVIKPPSETPFSCLAFTKLAVEAGIPSDCIQVLTTKDRDASAELVENPLVKKVSFTGSTGVGKALTKASAQTMKKVSMELGGNAPFIVFEDADLEKAIDGVLVCKYRCTGQTCVWYDLLPKRLVCD